MGPSLTWLPRRREAFRAIAPGVAALWLAAGCVPTRHDNVMAPVSAAARGLPPGVLEAYAPSREPQGRAAAEIPDPTRELDLAALVDLAERTHPETRRAWEQARAAAARLGEAESAYYPAVALLASAGWSKTVDDTKTGDELVRESALIPEVSLSYLLYDFGRRDADWEHAQERLAGANFAFDRTHQQVAFSVQRSFFAYDASRARVVAAASTLTNARTVSESMDAQLQRGLASRTDVLLARQEEARAAFELERARGVRDDAYAALAESIGIAPTVSLQITSLSEQPIPNALADTVDQVIDRALVQRPDLAARVAELRAREAEQRRAEAAFWPTLRLRGNGGGVVHAYRAGPPYSSHGGAESEGGAFLEFEWTLFDGGERRSKVRAAEAARGEAEAEIEIATLAALREVWRSYADVRTGLRQQEFAAALLAASQDAYDAALASYQAGLGSALDLLAAQRDLADAQATFVDSRAALLTSAASLAFAAGDIR
jgi:outer membrane protein TolC